MLLSLDSRVGGGVSTGFLAVLFITVVIILPPGNHAELNNTPESDMKAGGSWAVLSRSVRYILSLQKKCISFSFYLYTYCNDCVMLAFLFGSVTSASAF